ncbi:MAG: right-handed parallel beta-helix repeat-containing protein [Planctomycetaceae bacterium]|nr:right-handed parallel beta-helix repeat-containing protein [Planctomycetaceae bacterium]
MAKTKTKTLSPSVLLPNGKPFLTWQPVLTFSRTLYVDGRAAHASDDNAGTEAQPLRTVSRAAELLEPGQRVLVARGVYRERIVPARGGSAADKMIGYQAAPGAAVVLKGSRVVKGTWKKAGRSGGVWVTKLPAEWFAPDDNPFTTPNISAKQFDIMPWAEGYRGTLPYSLPCGLVFQNGKRLVQVAKRGDLAKAAGTYWVGEGGKSLYVRPFGGLSPDVAMMEITTQGQILAPREMGLGFVQVCGFTIEQVGNCFPMPQYGAVSPTRGHHWLVEGNIIRQCNGIALDIGNQHPTLPQPAIKPARHIVRGNVVTDCGVCGVQGLGTYNCLIEDNYFKGNAFHDVEVYFETASIKTHFTTDTLIRRNRVLRTLHGSGIWIDANNVNSRITENVVVDTSTMFGGIFVEISDKTNMVDRNVVWNTKGAGLYEHDCGSQIFSANFVGRTKGPAMWFRGAVTGRKLGDKPIADMNHTITGNILFANKQGINAPLEKQKLVANNLSEGIEAQFNRKDLTLTWYKRDA